MNASRTTMLAAAVLLAGCAATAQSRNMNRNTNLHGYASYSWGKANVNFKDYTAVVWECTTRGVLSPTHVDAPTNAINATRSITVTQQPALITEAPLTVLDAVVDTELEMRREDNQQRHDIIDACLVENGFHRFGLTQEQTAHLATLPHGSVERRQYLQELGANPEILRRQGI
ncbi:MAG TPA: hypothetical protein VG943_16470 [Caulobacterales bacterium]|nr:hypothetical protein [Caulobacterales bacterium]